MPLTIGQLAQRAGVPTSTLRHYERTGLLTPSGRTDGNYRTYDTDAIGILGFIRAAQASGFTLDDIRSLLDFRRGSTPPCDAVQDLIEHRLDELGSRMSELRRLQRTLKLLLDACRRRRGGKGCPVIDDLTPSRTRSSRRGRQKNLPVGRFP